MAKQKQLLTVRKEGIWHAYTHKTIRNIEHTIPISQDNKGIIKNLLEDKTSERYSLRRHENISQVPPKLQKAKHDIGYHRTVVLPLMTALGGTTLALAGLLSVSIGNIAGDTETGYEVSIAAVSAGITLNLAAGVLAFLNGRIVEANTKNKQAYDDKVDFINNLAAVREEIKLKEKVISKFVKLLMGKNSSFVLTEESKQTKLQENLYKLIDEQDNLYIYEKMERALTTLATARYLKKDQPLLEIIKECLKWSLMNDSKIIGTLKATVDKTKLETLLNFDFTDPKNKPLFNNLSQNVVKLFSNIDKIKVLAMFDELFKSNQALLKTIKEYIPNYHLMLRAKLKDIVIDRLLSNLEKVISDDSKAAASGKEEVNSYEKSLLNDFKSSLEISSRADTIIDLLSSRLENKDSSEFYAEFSTLMEYLIPFLEDYKGDKASAQMRHK